MLCLPYFLMLCSEAGDVPRVVKILSAGEEVCAGGHSSTGTWDDPQESHTDAHHQGKFTACHRKRVFIIFLAEY